MKRNWNVILYVYKKKTKYGKYTCETQLIHQNPEITFLLYHLTVYLFFGKVFLFQISKACHDRDCHSSEVIFFFFLLPMCTLIMCQNSMAYLNFRLFLDFFLLCCVLCAVWSFLYFSALNVPWEYLKYQSNHQTKNFKLFHWALKMIKCAMKFGQNSKFKKIHLNTWHKSI